jgi:phage-related minor tail protein
MGIATGLNNLKKTKLAKSIKKGISSAFEKFRKTRLGNLIVNAFSRGWKAFIDTKNGLINFGKNLLKIFNTPARTFKKIVEFFPGGKSLTNFLFKKRSLGSILNPFGTILTGAKKLTGNILRFIWNLLISNPVGHAILIGLSIVLLVIVFFMSIASVGMRNTPYMGDYEKTTDTDISRFLRAFTQQQIGAEFGGKKEL